jgi:transposase
LIERHVLAAERLHGDDTTVPILAKGKTVTGRIWVYVRDDRPFGGKDPPAALFYASRDRTASIPSGIWPVTPAFCRPTPTRLQSALSSRPQTRSDRRGAVLEPCAAKFFELADIAANARRGKNAAPISPIALEAVKRIDALFDIEREINGQRRRALGRAPGEERSPGRRAGSLDARRARQALPSMPSPRRSTTCSRVGGLHRFLDDGRICLTNNAAERALRGLALGRKSWLFAGSERGAERAALMYTLIRRPSSTTSIRRLGSPTSSPASPTSRLRAHPGSLDS